MNIAVAQANIRANSKTVENLTRDFRNRMRNAWAKTFVGKSRYKYSIPHRPRSIIEWMRAFRVAERATIEEIESHFWMRDERLQRMTNEELLAAKKFLNDNIHLRVVDEDISRIALIYLKHIQEHDALHLSQPVMGPISSYAFVAMVVNMHAENLWEGESIQALWNHYPIRCLQEEHPFGVRSCRWCGLQRTNEKDLVSLKEVGIEEEVEEETEEETEEEVGEEVEEETEEETEEGIGDSASTVKEVSTGVSLERYRMLTRKMKAEKEKALEEQREAEKTEEAERFEEYIAQEANKPLDERTVKRGRKFPWGVGMRRGRTIRRGVAEDNARWMTATKYDSRLSTYVSIGYTSPKMFPRRKDR